MSLFESVVRPTIGDIDAILQPEEQTAIEAIADVYVRVECLKDEDVLGKTRRGLISAMKSVRRGAELRHRKAELAAKRGRRYRYRATAPDGTELLYPTRGTKHNDVRYALIYRGIPKPMDQIEASVRAYYAPYLERSPTEAHTARLNEALARDIEVEAELQNRPSAWSLWTTNRDRTELERRAASFTNSPTSRYHYEYLVVEGVPFDPDAEDHD